MASELVSSNDAGERAYIDVDAGEESRRVSPDDIELHQQNLRLLFSFFQVKKLFKLKS